MCRIVSPWPAAEKVEHRAEGSRESLGGNQASRQVGEQARLLSPPTQPCLGSKAKGPVELEVSSGKTAVLMTYSPYLYALRVKRKPRRVASRLYEKVLVLLSDHSPRCVCTIDVLTDVLTRGRTAMCLLSGDTDFTTTDYDHLNGSELLHQTGR